jgi:cyclomaltodextrinase
MTTKRSKAPKLPEFIFGALSTPEGRLQQARLARLGFFHDSTLRPPDPREAEPVTVTVRAGVDVAIKEATLYYSTDGSPLQIPPDCRSPSVFAVSMERSELTWDTLQWGYFEEWAAEIPGQPIGTHVQYAIQGITNQAEIIFSPFINTSTAELTESREDDALRWLNRLVRQNRPRVYGFVVDDLGIPAWLQEAVIYQIFTERFAPDPGSSFDSPADRSGCELSVAHTHLPKPLAPRLRSDGLRGDRTALGDDAGFSGPRR